VNDELVSRNIEVFAGFCKLLLALSEESGVVKNHNRTQAC